jgi:hypothetical protein
MSTETTTPEEIGSPAVTPEQVTTPTDATAAPADEPTQAELRTFTQEQLNEIIQKEKAKAEAKAERRALKAYRETLERFAPQAPIQQQSDGKPQRAAFNGDDEAYIEAVADWKIDQRDQQTRQQREAERHQSTVTKTEKLYTEASKLPGFDRDTFEELPLTPSIAQALIDSDAAPQLMAYMASNPDDIERISKLSPARQAAELGKLEARLSTVKQHKEPPAPIRTVTGGGTVNHGDPSKMPMDQYIEWRKKNGAKWAR